MEMKKSKMNPGLAEVAQRLERWRRLHGGHGRRIPEELWTAIVATATTEEVGAAARALGVKKEQLERRLARQQEAEVVGIAGGSRSPSGHSQSFVEVDSQRVFSGGQMTVRLTSREGEQVEIALPGTMTDAMVMVQALWSRER